MSESTPAPGSAEVLAEVEAVPAGGPPGRILVLDRTPVAFALFLGAGLVVFIAAFLTVHDRRPEALTKSAGAMRSHRELMHWLHDGYFRDCGLLMPVPLETTSFYRSSTGGYLVSALIVQKIYSRLAGHYSWRLIAWHNQVITLLLSALLGLLAYRITRRIGLDGRLACATGASVVIIMFSFPSNLALYWEMSPQVPALLFAIVFLLLEERCAGGDRELKWSLAQAAAAFLMTYMETTFALAFICALAVPRLMLEQRSGAWRRFVLLAVLPCAAAFVLYLVQLGAASARFPNAPMTGSTFMFRSGLDGESLYYGDHLDIALGRDGARGNWAANREHLFVWMWVFVLGSLASFAVLAAYIAGRAPRIAVEVLTALAGGWLLYAAVFSQAVVIHPYLYDVLLFAPLAVALFALAPALVESLTRRTGAIVMVVVLCACWYSLFQMRRYALWYPMPGAQVAASPEPRSTFR